MNNDSWFETGPGGALSRLEMKQRSTVQLREDAVAKKKPHQAKLPSPSKRRAIRVCAGASLVEVGELVGVSGEAIRLWETGQRAPSETHRDDYIGVLKQLQAG